MIKNKYQKFNKHYIRTNKKILIKDYFKHAYRILKKKFKKNKKFSLIDAGCASGFFIDYTATKFSNVQLAGFDFSNELIKLAKKDYPFADFYIRNLLNKKFKKINQKYDVVTCLGTLHAFDNIKTPLQNLFKLTKKGGKIIIFTLVNSHDVNVISRYQKNYGDDNNWYTAFNNFSKPYWYKNIKNINKNCKIKFHKFTLAKPLKKRKDPMRSWTIDYGKVKNQLTVGTSQLLTYNFIEINN
jgi:2-polyprenyl-3-methyl-5-hydroxy-6-metoxy-1,4-benzoquinol methylase